MHLFIINQLWARIKTFHHSVSTCLVSVDSWRNALQWLRWRHQVSSPMYRYHSSCFHFHHQPCLISAMAKSKPAGQRLQQMDWVAISLFLLPKSWSNLYCENWIYFDWLSPPSRLHDLNNFLVVFICFRFAHIYTFCHIQRDESYFNNNNEIIKSAGGKKSNNNNNNLMVVVTWWRKIFVWQMH